jgi:competence protein ComEC
LSVSGVLKEAKLLSPLAPVGSIKVVEERLVREPPIWVRLSESWRANLLEFLSRSLPEEERAELVAFLFGDRQGLDPDQVSEIVDSGAIQLLSATGLPIIGILALFEAFGNFFPVPRTALLAAATLLLIAFGLACGLHVSTVRTSGVLLVDRWSYLVKRTPDLISLAALMGIVVLALDPWQVFNVGFALSLLAMMAYARYCRVPIIRRVQVSNNWKSAAREVGSTWLRTSAVMSLVALPILACFQHHISLSNILVLPLLSSYVPLLAAVVVTAHVLGWIYLPIGVGMLEICVRPLTKLLFIALIGTSSNALTLDIPEFSPYWLVPYFAALLILGERYARR